MRDRLLFLLSAEQFYGGKSTNAGRGQAVMLQNEVFGTLDNQAGGLPCLIFAAVDASQR